MRGSVPCSTSLTQPEGVSVFHFVYTDLVPSSVVMTESRRQSVLVCSLLVVSLLLPAAVGGEGELRGLSICTPYRLLEIIKIFYKNSKDVGMAQKVQKQVKAVTQWSINHGPYMQECRTL